MNNTQNTTGAITTATTATWQWLRQQTKRRQRQQHTRNWMEKEKKMIIFARFEFFVMLH